MPGRHGKQKVADHGLLKRPAAKVSRKSLKRPGGTGAQAGLTADAPETVTQAGLTAHVLPRARNAFQLFYAHALKSTECTNAKAASTAWGNLGEEDRQHYVRLALQEKQEQLRVRSSLGLKTRQTEWVRKAMSSQAAAPLDAQTPDSSEKVNVTTGSWELQWLDEPGQEALAGKGSFGSAYKGLHRRTGMQGAVKVFPSQSVFREECAREVDIYMHIAPRDKQRLFLHVLESGLDAPIPYFVLPWAGDSLAKYFRQVRSGTGSGKLPHGILVNAVVMQTADALLFLHSLGIVHTDVKPSNLMLDTQTRRVVIIDFNASERPQEDGWTPSRDTYAAYPYRAPELWASWRQQHRMAAHRACTCAVDIWAYGVTCVEAIRGG